MKFEEQKDADALLAKYEKIATAFQNVGEKKEKKETTVEDEEGDEDGED